MVESTENNKNEDGSVKINLLRMEVNKVDERINRYKIEILYEIDEKNENDFIYLNDNCEYVRPDETTHKIKRIIKGDKGKKLILIEDFFINPVITQIYICLEEYIEYSYDTEIKKVNKSNRNTNFTLDKIS